jgi:hypothetical protein
MATDPYLDSSTNQSDNPIQERVREQRNQNTLEGQFKEKQGLAARAYRKGAIREESSPDNQNRLEALAQAEQLYQLTNQMTQQRLAMGKRLGQRASRAAVEGVAKVAARRFGALWLVGGVTLAYLAQAFFGLLSLGAIATQATLGNSTVVQAFLKVASFFSGSNLTAPFEALGMLFYVISFFIATLTFIILSVYYSLMDESFGSDSGSLGIAFVCFACSLMPILNILPWLLGWVIYMEASSLMKMARRFAPSLFRGRGAPA